MAIKKGDKVSVHYTGTLEDGSVFDSSIDRGQPLEFEVGSGQLIRGFDSAVIGMEKGQEREVTLKPGDAYGDPNPAMMQDIPRDKLPKEHEPQPGMMLVMTMPNGMQVPVKITKVTQEKVTLDLNHPLAGRTLKFKIKIVDVKEGTKLEVGSTKGEAGGRKAEVGSRKQEAGSTGKEASGEGLKEMAGFKEEEKQKKEKNAKGKK